MAHPQRKQESEIDARRGIQNTQSRFTDFTEERLTNADLQKSANDERFESSSQTNKNNNSEYEKELLQQHSAHNQQQIASAMQHKQQSVLERKKSSQGSIKPMRLFRFVGIALLASAALFQLIFGIWSAVWFGLAATQSAACDTTIGSAVCGVAGFLNSAVESVSGIDIAAYLSFENIGWLFWVLILLITLSVFFGFLLQFLMQDLPVLDNSLAFFGTSTAVALNLIPFFNIFPWIEIWALYWVIVGTSEAFGLSKNVTAS